MPYLIWGSAASLVPATQLWADVVLGTDLGGRNVRYDKKEVTLQFDSCSRTLFAQWENAVEAASGGSIGTITMLDRDSVSFKAFSGVYLNFQDRPVFEAGIARGSWSIRVTEAAS